jgi:glycosyltransferase involved in cell wall biosynthesis
LPEVVEMLEQLLQIEWEWHLAGDDRLDSEYARQFNEKLRRSRISQRVTYLGTLKQEVLLSLYRQYDIFLLPSQFESCSMVTMEAMTAGLPVVAFAVGGLPELIADGLNGFSVPAGNWSVLREKLQVLLTDQSLRKTLGRKGYQRSKKFPTWKKSARRVSDFLSEAVVKRSVKKLPDSI